ncbi:hypothetical protein D6V29_03770, partial [Vibrio cholerae]|nr:hypothetical protein [Vibrio cholerae]
VFSFFGLCIRLDNNATICCIKQPSGAKKQRSKTGPQMKNELLARLRFEPGFYFNDLPLL